MFEILNQPIYSRDHQFRDVKLHGYSLFLFGPKNRFRLWVKSLVQHEWFDPFIILVIIVSTVCMAVDNPLNDPDGALSNTLAIIDIVITTIFCLESFLKII